MQPGRNTGAKIINMDRQTFICILLMCWILASIGRHFAGDHVIIPARININPRHIRIAAIITIATILITAILAIIKHENE